MKRVDFENADLSCIPRVQDSRVTFAIKFCLCIFREKRRGDKVHIIIVCTIALTMFSSDCKHLFIEILLIVCYTEPLQLQLQHFNEQHYDYRE